MPTYEYICQKCGKTFEVFQSMKDAPLKTCTCCKNGRVKRLVGRGAGIIFKGSGFYETDYKRGPAKSGGGKSGGGPAVSSGASPATISASSTSSPQ
jgi:putative FmdB family regulatory protein